jgi:hypothetical protein
LKELKYIDEMSEGVIIRNINDENLRDVIENAKFTIIGEN